MSKKKKQNRDAKVKRVLKNKTALSVINYENVLEILLTHIKNNVEKNYGSIHFISRVNPRNGTFEVFELTAEEEEKLNLPVEIYF